MGASERSDRKITLGTGRDPQRGASAVLVLVVLVGLLGVGGTALLASRSEVGAAGAMRLHQQALYAAESGASVAMEYLRGACTPEELFSALVEPSNVSPQKPADIVGNGLPAGQNVFAADTELGYEVTILNNADDPGYGDGTDRDGVVVLRVVGRAADRAQAVVEIEVVGDDCLATACSQEYAQRGITARNDSFASCASQITSNTLTTHDLEAP